MSEHQVIHQFVEHEAAFSPEAVAIVGTDVSVGYRDLNTRANRLARELRARGASRGSRVAVALADTEDFVVAALAALKTGAAYVPIDPGYPRERRKFMIGDSRSDLVVNETGEAYDPSVSAVGVNAPELADHPGDDLGVPVSPLDPAYVIYTSGSTGRPKGVVVDHAAVVGLLSSDPRLAVGRGQTVAHLAPTSFDASTFELWAALTAGGTVAVLADRGVSIESLGRGLRERRPDWMFLTTGLFHLLVDRDPDALAGVGVLITGGDVLSPRHVRTAASSVGGRLYAAYGPTETTVFASLHAVDPGREQPRVPLGSALRNTTLRILDGDLREVPVGTGGEIYISGEGLAHGYHDRPATTAGVFLPDPYSSDPGARMYRTGDRGRRLPDGEFDFLGRVDRQVKVRGFRIEPAEIEIALAAHPDVGSAAVAVAVHARGDKRIAAYVAPSGAVEPTVPGLREWVADRLPAHMAPHNYLVLDRLPLDPNGKVDRGSLPAPWTSRSELGLAQDYVASRTDTERLVARTVADVLGLDEVGRHDDFFEIGGDSLSSVRVLEHLRAEGLNVSAREFFADSTPAALAAVRDDSPVSECPALNEAIA